MSIFRGPEGRTNEDTSAKSNIASLKNHLMSSVSPEAMMTIDGVSIHHDTANTMEAAKIDMMRVLGGQSAMRLEALEFPQAANDNKAVRKAA